MLLTDILENSAKVFSRRPALTMRLDYRTHSLTYQEVYELSQKIALLLERDGVDKGDKALLLAPNSPYWICVFWGCLLRGAVPVPLNIQSTDEFVAKVAKETEAKIILKSYDLELVKEKTAGLNPKDFHKVEAQEDDLAELLYTSGTTGEPKGVMLTHKNISANLEALAKNIPLSSEDSFLSILPLSHIFEQVAGFLLPFSRGCHIVYAHSPAAIRSLLNEYHITHMSAVPEFLRLMMARIEAEAEERGKKRLFETMLSFSDKIGIKPAQRLLFRSVLEALGGKLHTVASGGAPLDPLLERKWGALGIYLLQGYGLTETSPVVSCNTYKERKIGSVGKILPGVEVKIAADGEILVKGPSVFQGYYKNELKTKEAFTASWFMTGDMGELDKDGFLFLKGRKKYMIKGPGAQNVFPEDIEFELNKIPDIEDSCVIGVETPSGMTEIHAVLLLKERARQPEEIIREANKHLASYQQSTGWSLWPGEDFPRSATRKVKKDEVMRWVRETKPKKEKAAGPHPSVSLLVKLLAEITGVDVREIHPQTQLVRDLKLDSLLRIELAARIEETLGAFVEESKINSETTVRDLETMTQEKRAATKRPKLARWPRSRLASWKRLLTQNLFIFPILRLWVKLEVEGAEHLKNLTLPAVFMPNHISYLDSAAVVMALPSHIRNKIAFAAAQDVVYEKYRHVAWLAELFFNAFPFPRQEGENIKLGLEYMGRLLDGGWSIVVYPEGRMSPSGQLQPLKRGAGLIAQDMDAAIVPVKIIGSANIMPYGKFIPRSKGRVTVRFGAPLKFSPSAKLRVVSLPSHRRDSYIEATEKIQEALEQL